ncbi:keratin, type I cytoskeletal 9-like isoform X2 [Salmo trutta]|uniref:keratin, type I cytoskeletal 9-like isoform X2 n=1 Tax=Salmo trutta TaxID=8032 RepID=UPI0011302751|nr:keratin, type I cytoskeletal 9-like isoform X2 [Salmo trutta]
MVISTMRDSTAALRRQVEEQEESVVKSQADFSVYRATHIHSDSDYDSQLCHDQELQQAFSQTMEQCAQGSQDLSVCQSEVRQLREEVSRLTQLKDNTVAEVLRLQEAGRQLQAEAMMEGQRRLEEVGAQEQRAARLEQDLQAAHRQCAKRQQAVQKRDNLLRRSEADLLEARETLKSRAVEVERQPAAAMGLEADVQRAGREGQQRGRVWLSQDPADDPQGGTKGGPGTLQRHSPGAGSSGGEGVAGGGGAASDTGTPGRAGGRGGEGRAGPEEAIGRAAHLKGETPHHRT